MSNRYRVSLNGNHLDAVNSKIFILDIQYPETGYDTRTDTLGNKNGAVISRRYKGRAVVNVQFCINAYSTSDRQSVYQSVIQWAKGGGVLVCNDRANMSLRHAVFDGISELSAKNWTDPITVSFADYVFPFWENDTETTVSLSAGTSSSGTLKIPGSAEKTYVYGTITAKASVTWIKIFVGDTMFHLSGLSLSNNDVVTISYDDQMNLQIKKGSTSLLDKRSGDDDLVVTVNENTAVQVTSDANVASVLKGRGCWM